MKDRFVKLAIQQAIQSLMPNRLGAVLVNKKTVLGCGFNRNDHPILYTGRVPRLHPNMGIHAEVAALLNLSDKVTKDAILYVVRLRKDNSLALSKPCSSCEWYIQMMGIKRVVYSLDNGTFERMKV